MDDLQAQNDLLYAENIRLRLMLRELPQQIKDRCEREAGQYDSFLEKDYSAGIRTGGWVARSVVLATVRRLVEGDGDAA